MQRRDEVIISLLIYQALTVQEIATINTEDINLEAATIKAKGGYKQKLRTLSLQASQILLLHNYIKEDREKIIHKTKRYNPFIAVRTRSENSAGICRA